MPEVRLLPAQHRDPYLAHDCLIYLLEFLSLRDHLMSLCRIRMWVPSMRPSTV